MFARTSIRRACRSHPACLLTRQSADVALHISSFDGQHIVLQVTVGGPQSAIPYTLVLLLCLMVAYAKAWVSGSAHGSAIPLNRFARQSLHHRNCSTPIAQLCTHPCLLTCKLIAYIGCSVTTAWVLNSMCCHQSYTMTCIKSATCESSKLLLKILHVS